MLPFRQDVHGMVQAACSQLWNAQKARGMANVPGAAVCCGCCGAADVRETNEIEGKMPSKRI